MQAHHSDFILDKKNDPFQDRFFITTFLLKTVFKL